MNVFIVYSSCKYSECVDSCRIRGYCLMKYESFRLTGCWLGKDGVSTHVVKCVCVCVCVCVCRVST